jgi:Ca2+-binding EF-hand superfamily protein
LSKEELVAAPDAQIQLLKNNIDAGFSAVDKNSDGFLSKIENNRGQMVVYEFNKIDKNKDGYLDIMELNAYFPYNEIVTYMDKYSDSQNKPYAEGTPK